MSRPKSERQRLLGFGPLGWIALVVVLGLVATQIAGLDLVVLHVNAIHALGGRVVMMPWLEAADMLVTVAVLWIVTASWRVALCVALLQGLAPDRDHCSVCGYPVRGLPGTTCPECGGSLAAQDRAMSGVPACGATAVEVPS